MLSSPLQFEPWLLPKVWGGARLQQQLLKANNSAELLGESWELSDHASHSSIVTTGPLTGMTLRHLMSHHRESLLGQSLAKDVFPLLVKFLDANDWLSVQVHPNDDIVQRLLPGEGGKTEAWIILDAEPGSRVYAGLLPHVNESELRKALSEGTVAKCLHSFEPKAGQCLYLPAGTVHAVGGGVLMAEVQQTSDATFRLFDWNRVDQSGQSRELHIEQALKSINWQQGQVNPISITDQTTLIDCPYFSMKHHHGNETIVCGQNNRAEILIALEGQGQLRGQFGQQSFQQGTTCLLPASMEEVECVPESSWGFLQVILP